MWCVKLNIVLQLIILNKNYDKNGILASKGTPIKKEITKFLKFDFFKKLPPKSLDKHSFTEFYNDLLKKNYSFFTGKSLVNFFQNHTLEYFQKSHRNSVILKILGSIPPLVTNFTPIRKLWGTFLYLCYCNPRPIL